MPAYTISEMTVLTTMTCGSCGVLFAIPEFMRAEKERIGGIWTCPNGHGRTYSKTELDRVKEELRLKTIEASRQRENYFAEQRKHEQTQKEMRRIKKRVGNGVCPCCKRTFRQLSRHMETKHPDFKAETA